MIPFLGLFISLLFWTGCVQAQTSSGTIPPTDFKITSIAGGLSVPSQASKIDIDSKGHAIYYTMTTDGSFKEINEFNIDSIALKRIYGAIAQADFFNLKEEYTDTGALDGSYAQITVFLHGQIHTVRTQNVVNQAFDDINIAINLSSPKDDKIRYNAIL